MNATREPLPIDAVIPELLAALARSGAVVLRAPTGAGKTTRVPPALVADGLVIASTIEYSTRRNPGMWFRPRWEDVWFPDAFVGTMAQLLVAIEDGTEPEISGRDNIETIALCEAVFTAAKEHRVVTMREFL